LERIVINTLPVRSEIMVGESWTKVAEMLPSSGTVIVTDENVFNIYGAGFPQHPVLKIKPGEESKKLAIVEELSESLLSAGIDRTGFILAVGGGVVCDIAGFLASIYMRGIRCGYVSTSLLSQVDASTGGKTGVNLGSAKNMLGVIRQPEFVICDTSMLQTLPEEEYLSGLAELIKTAVIGDKELFGIIEANHHKIMERDIELLTLLVARCVRFKASVVSEDELENGLRRILNFGHTFGHAIELHEGIKHGFAVAAGMELAAWLSFEKGYLSLHETERISSLLTKFGLIPGYNIRDKIIGELILHDKKKSGNQIHFVFSEGIGQAVSVKMPVAELTEFYRKFRDKK
jgi:3-dehydroquinate synthase